MSHSLKIALSFSFAFMLIWVQTVQAADDPSQVLSKTNEMLNKGKAKSAAVILRELIASHPDNAEAHMQLGAALASLVDNDNYDAAITEEKAALKLDPKSYGARKILGHIYANLHKSQESITILGEACALNPKSYAAQRDLATAQMAAGNNDEAISAYKKAIALNPNKVDAHLKLSLLLSKKENFKEAIAEAHKAVKLDLSNPESHLMLANATLASGDKAGSIESFETAIQNNEVKGYRNPLTAASALSGLGWAFSGKDAEKKQLAEAVNDQRKAIKIFPAFGPAYVRLAELLSMQGKNKEAEVVYKNSLRLSAEDTSVANAYAKFLDRIGRKDEASSLLNRASAKSPNIKQ